MEQSHPCSENDAQWFRDLVSHLILFRLHWFSQATPLSCHNPDVKRVPSPPGSVVYYSEGLREDVSVREVEAVGSRSAIYEVCAYGRLCR